ncbi:streptomycin 3''-adenylyltransferase [Microdochium trichocladiopsis]|uniref:Streptomycin 3''-adenylyltransferase n=1 Tax=Microdochium trichocladiopsis TaxID=1682393 RepID=A0A9P8XSD5_9PEZI|nr:streptomycin 3''-adenylyltransferase [Microdochium trichocladiopsis]KAH7014544.1 streptomycin 3''-adenylyltransferase [Microdochium trichocladiopsis]
MTTVLPREEEAYLGELVTRLTGNLGSRLVGVYLFGSASTSAYEPGRSDLDVQAVVEEPLTPGEKQAIIQRLTQQVLPCPARKLEFVVYARGSVNPASRHPRFEINLNTGPHEPDHVCLDPEGESSHWFLLDIAMGSASGRSLHGPAVADVFAPIPRRWTLEAIADSLEWHRANELTSANSVLNACRGWRYIATNTFGSKLAGAEWARQREDCPAVVERAVAARKMGEALPAVDVGRLYDLVIAANRSALDEVI